MCELATASLVLAGIGTAVSAYGQLQAGQAASAQARYQAAVARNNAILSERAAQDAEARGRAAEDRRRRETALLIGRQRAVLAANGVVVDTGSALDITAGTREVGELDALTIRSNAEREALALRAQGANFETEAELAGLRGRSALAEGRIGAFGTALSGSGTVAQRWYQFRREGAFGTRQPTATL